MKSKTNKCHEPWKKIGIALLSAFVVIQFFRPARNKSTQVLATDITHVAAVPQEVQGVLRKSCYDCHSNNTVYPWYMNVQPAAWYLANHISEGRRELNFSDFGSYTPKKQLKKFQKIVKEVKAGDMPLSSYTLIHTNSRLSKEEQSLIINWADSLAGRY